MIAALALFVLSWPILMLLLHFPIRTLGLDILALQWLLAMFFMSCGPMPLVPTAIFLVGFVLLKLGY